MAASNGASEENIPFWRRRRTIAAGIVIVSLTLLITFKNSIATFTAIAILQNAGYPELGLEVTAFNTQRAEIRNIRLSPDVLIKSSVVTYTLSQVFSGRVDKIALTGVVIAGRLADGAVTIRGVPSDGAAVGGDLALPFHEMAISDAAIRLDMPNGQIRASLDGGALYENDLQSQFRFSAEANTANLSAQIAGKANLFMAQSGEALGHVLLTAGSVQSPAVQTKSLTGAIQFIRAQTGAIDVTLNTAADGILADGRTLGPVELNLGIQSESFAEPWRTQLTVRSEPLRLSFDGSVRLANGANALEGVLQTRFRQNDLTAEAAGTVQAATDAAGKLTTQLNLTNAAASHPQFQLSEASGVISAAYQAGEPPAASADIRLTAANGGREFPGHISASLSKEGIAANGLFDWPDGQFNFEATTNAALTQTEFSLMAETTPAWAARWFDPAFTGAGKIRIAAKGNMPFSPELLSKGDPAALLKAANIQTRLSIDVKDAALPGAFGGGNVQAGLEIRYADNSVTVTATDKVQANLRELAFKPTLPPEFSELTDGPYRLETAKTNAELLQITDIFGAPEIHLLQDLRLQSPAASLRTQLPAMLSFHPAAGAFEAEIAGAVLELRLKYALTATANATFRGIRASPQTAVAAYSVDLRAEHAFGAVKGELVGQLTRQDQLLSVHVSPKSSVQIQSLRKNTPVQLRRPVDITLDAAASVSINLATRQPRYKITLNPVKLDAVLLSDGKPQTVTAVIPNTAMMSEGKSHKVTFSQGEISLPDRRLSATGIGADIRLGSSTDIKLAVDAISQQESLPWFVPLKLTAAGTLQNGTATFTAKLADPAERIVIDATGAHDMASQKGKAEISARKLTFLPTVLQPRDLFPALKGTISEADGTVDARADIAWTADNLTSSLNAAANFVKLSTDEVSGANIAVDVHFDNLFPPSTPPNQVIEVGTLDIGIPLTTGRILGQLNPDGTTQVRLENFDMFGGRIETKPFTMPKNYDDFTVLLSVTGIRLEELLELTKFGDLQATGVLDGTIPVKFSNGEVAVRNGRLKTTGGGSLKYNPKAVGDALKDVNQGTKLFLDVVKDFKYDSIEVTLDESEFEEIEFGFNIKGKNEAVYGGIPVELKVNLSGPLRKILKQGRDTLTVPAWLQDRMKELGQ